MAWHCNAMPCHKKKGVMHGLFDVACVFSNCKLEPQIAKRGCLYYSWSQHVHINALLVYVYANLVNKFLKIESFGNKRTFSNWEI